MIKFENNKPVADFYCEKCGEQYELKSTNKILKSKITDGAYETAIKRIESNSNPNLFVLQYDQNKVKNLIFVPKYFFTSDIIEKRKPLAPTARRAGWIGCNIIYGNIPSQGRISVIDDGKVMNIDTVVKSYQSTLSLNLGNLDTRGWLLDILNCVNAIPSTYFEIKDVYKFTDELYKKHPNNNHIQDKIRQQLQFLRDKGFIEFLGGGHYRKV